MKGGLTPIDSITWGDYISFRSEESGPSNFKPICQVGTVRRKGLEKLLSRLDEHADLQPLVVTLFAKIRYLEDE